LVDSAVAVGQVVWRAFATNLGVVPVPTVPAWVIAVLAVGVLLVANLLAIAPAFAAARSKSVGNFFALSKPVEQVGFRHRWVSHG
jgi:ABC-type Mn2+/Zn2+ transport system permease subunit